MTRVAINGFGRTGRLIFRHMMESPDGLEVVGVNDVGDVDDMIYLLGHDTVHKCPQGVLTAGEHHIGWEDRKVQISQIRNPAELPWKELCVDLVVEATGRFTHRADAAKHLDAGAGRVIITAPSRDADATFCMGVNEEKYDAAEHFVISNGSCTTNCLAPVAKVLDEEFGIVNGLLNTVHAYTASQLIVDGPKKKHRRGRAGAQSIVPTTTGATTAVAQTLPQLEGKMHGMAMRVPVIDGSVIDFVAQTERPASIDAVNDAFRKWASSDGMRGVLGITDDELVSSDIIHTNWSALVDAPSTMVVGEHLVRVVAWYDNEWGYARRVRDLAGYISEAASMRRAA